MSSRIVRLADGSREILAEAEADARDVEESGPFDWDDDECDTYLATLNEATAERYAAQFARVLAADPVTADELERGAPW
jgi:regulator of protease activity HflC (stomatin/prohibitin superfamily)